MKKITQWKTKLACTVAYLCIVLLLRYANVPCIFIRFLGIPCPGCGMTRAMLAAFRLDWAAAFAYHPMFWSMPILYLYFLFDGRLLGKQKLDRFVLIFFLVGFLLQWVHKLVTF